MERTLEILDLKEVLESNVKHLENRKKKNIGEVLKRIDWAIRDLESYKAYVIKMAEMGESIPVGVDGAVWLSAADDLLAANKEFDAQIETLKNVIYLKEQRLELVSERERGNKNG